jgi:hypothetical protein
MKKIPLLLNTNNIVNNSKNQILFLIHSFTINEWLKELTDNKSNIYELLKEEVEELFLKTGGYLIIYLDFDSCYRLAIESTINQIKKNIRRNEKCFFEIEKNENLLIYKKVKERLVNNVKNLFDLKRKNNIINHKIWLMDEIYENYEIDFTVRDLQKLANNEPELIIKHIKKLVINFELTITEVEELEEKLNINLSNIIELDLSLQFRNLVLA